MMWRTIHYSVTLHIIVMYFIIQYYNVQYYIVVYRTVLLGPHTSRRLDIAESSEWPRPGRAVVFFSEFYYLHILIQEKVTFCH